MEENDDDEDDEDEDFDEDMEESEEEVEILVSFEEDGREYHLVRLLDPVLLVGKVSLLCSILINSILVDWYLTSHLLSRSGKGGNENTRILLSPEESDIVMPKLEQMFMNYQED